MGRDGGVTLALSSCSAADADPDPDPDPDPDRSGRDPVPEGVRRNIVFKGSFFAAFVALFVLATVIISVDDNAAIF